jgi:small ligand-binding sensory domain FIST
MESAPALSLTAGVLPGVSIVGFHVNTVDLPSPDAPPDTWAQVLGIPATDDPHFLVLADPFTMDGEALLTGMDYAFPQAAKIGGLASGGTNSGPHGLFLNDDIFRQGAVGVGMTGNLIIDTVVAQGCRPIGQPMQVTEADRNLIVSVDGQSTVDRLQQIYESLPTRDKELVHSNLFMGIAMNPIFEEGATGNFLIRNVLGISPQRNALAVGALVREGQLVQFHVRDAQTSSEDLRNALSAYANTAGDRAAVGALLFSCTGRGQYLYGKPDHDTDTFRQLVGELPLGGFFCNGEIGPVSGTTYLHGYTSSFALFRPRTVSD